MAAHQAISASDCDARKTVCVGRLRFTRALFLPSREDRAFDPIILLISIGGVVREQSRLALGS
jgi:hypothetical protein